MRATFNSASQPYASQVAALRSLLRGLSLAMVFGSLALALLFLIGAVTPNPGLRYVSLLGAASGVLFGLIGPRAPRLEAFGSSLLGLLALVVGFGGGWNVIWTSVIVGALAAALWMLVGEPRLRGWWVWFKWGGMLLPLVVLVLFPLVIGGGMLGHDESAYAVKARQWLEGTPGTGWSPHRAPALSLIAYPLLAAGGIEADLRLVGLIGGIGLIVAVWFLADRLSNPVAAALAAAGIVSSPAVLYRSTEFLSDVPAAALLVTAMFLVWREFGGSSEPSYRLLWAVPVALLAFYLRYQSVLSIGLIILVIPLLWWPKLRARPRPYLAALGLGLLGMVPHLIQATVMEGAPWRLVTTTADAAGRSHLGEGLVDYFVQSRWALGAFVAPLAIVAALLGLWVGRRERETRTRLLFLLIPSGVQVLALGLVAHGEPRFIIFPLALVVVAGAMVLQGWFAGTGRALVVGAAWAYAVLLFSSLGFAASYARQEVAERVAAFVPMQEATGDIRELAGGAPCVVMTTYAPQVTFYTGCVTRVFPLDPVGAVDDLGVEGRFALLVDPGLSQPEGEARESLLEVASDIDVFEGRLNQVTVARFAD